MPASQVCAFTGAQGVRVDPGGESVPVGFENEQKIRGDTYGNRRGLLTGDVCQSYRGLDPIDGGVVVTALGP